MTLQGLSVVNAALLNLSIFFKTVTRTTFYPLSKWACQLIPLSLMETTSRPTQAFDHHHRPQPYPTLPHKLYLASSSDAPSFGLLMETLSWQSTDTTTGLYAVANFVVTSFLFMLRSSWSSWTILSLERTSPRVKCAFVPENARELDWFLLGKPDPWMRERNGAVSVFFFFFFSVCRDHERVVPG